MNDQELLREYREGGSERAFQSLVQRHVDLVYSTALRRLGDAGLAEEVTQNVFIVLARKAPFLNRHIGLAGWLYKTALLEARHRQRAELRRKHREETAVAIGTTMKAEDSLLKSLSPVLDEALMELREKERHAVLLRFFENKDLREVGEALGVGEDAAQKRVAKALERLTRAFRRRGYTVPAATGIGAALHGVTQTAPAALASVAAQTALQSARVVSIGGLGLLITKFMGLTKTQTAALCLLVSAMPVAYEWNALSEARAEQQTRQVQLNGFRQTLAERQGEQEQIQRRLRVASDTLMHLQSEQTRRKALAASIPAGNNPNLYLWSEASEYVRLPKSLFPAIQLYDATMVSAEGSSESGPDRPTWAPRLTKAGKVSSLLLETLGLDDAASAQVKAAFLDYARDYRDLEKSHTVLTNTLPKGLHINNSEFQTLFTAPFPAEGEALKTRLQASIERIAGKERSDVLWQSLSGAVFGEFNNSGADEKMLILRFGEDGSALITEWRNGYQGLTLVRPLDKVPEVFKPFVEEWKVKQKP